MDVARDHDGSWWSRPAGGREVTAVALPLVMSTLSWTLMTFIDRMILHHVSGVAMSAAFTSSIAWFATFSFAFGVCSYASTFVSQYFGDGQPERIGPTVWQGVWLAITFAPIALLLRPLTPLLFSTTGHEAELLALEIQFFQILCFAAPAMLTAQSLESFYSGRGRTWVVMFVDGGAVLVNLVLACVWVLGLGGIESWGMPGAAWATVCAQWFRAISYTTLVLRRENRRQFNTTQAGIDWGLIRRLVRFGGPSGVQMFLDVGGFTVFVVLVGRLGLVEAEATSLAFSVGQFAFMPVWGFGIATTVLVGQRLGEDRPDLASRAAMTSLVLALSYMGALSLLFVLGPQLFLSGFFAGEAAEALGHSGVRELAVTLLRFVAAYNMLDATAIILVSVLKGAGDTRFVMRLSIGMSALLAGATWLAVEPLRLGVHECWAIVTVWVWILGLAYLMRFRGGAWKRMRVIDQVHHHGAVPVEPPPADGFTAAALESPGAT